MCLYLDVCPVPAPTPAKPVKVGDIVDFTGGPVYGTSDAATATVTREASRCKVTLLQIGGKHPYHLISEDGGVVWGWCDANNVK